MPFPMAAVHTDKTGEVYITGLVTQAD
jgi:hypothetical protein